MTEKEPQIVINISGGNNQILPTATHAEQHFHGGSPAAEEPAQEAALPDNLQRLSIYISNEEARARYIARLQACQSAAEVGKTVAALVQETPGLTIDTAKTEPFITILLHLAKQVKSGTTVPNFRKAIENAWFVRKD